METNASNLVKQLLKIESSSQEVSENLIEWRLPNGNLHREFGPAVIDNLEGRFEWWKNGERHREDGPAIEIASGVVQYFFLGIEVLSKKYFEKCIKIKNQAVSKNKSFKIIGATGEIYYFNSKCELHREDGPAVYWEKDYYCSYFLDSRQLSREEFEIWRLQNR